MAYKDSSELQANENYALGDYSFRIERSSVPGSTNDKIEAICTQGGKNARKSIQVPSSAKLDGWYVEANSDTADVYAVVRKKTKGDDYTSDLDTGSFTQPIPTYGSAFFKYTQTNVKIEHTHNFTYPNGAIICVSTDSALLAIGASDTQNDVVIQETHTIVNKTTGETTTETQNRIAASSYTHNGKTVYYTKHNYSHYTGKDREYSPSVSGYGDFNNTTLVERAAWTIIYGTSEGQEYGDSEIVLVGRFAIDLVEAGGVGPGSDWIDPGDYEDGWEPDEPTHTLNVEIDGALSGRHNDPLNDTSYSYVPADKETIKDYGCGGDGGNGGGGGAGASNIVVFKFATNRANSKEIVCKPKRHGYGSGGGKGGKGGDGCILIYY